MPSPDAGRTLTRLVVFVKVNGVRLFVEVLGTSLVPAGPLMIERPTVVALHGGPSDHAHMHDAAGPLSAVAQVVLYDNRGCGRSEDGASASLGVQAVVENLEHPGARLDHRVSMRRGELAAETDLVAVHAADQQDALARFRALGHGHGA